MSRTTPATTAAPHASGMQVPPLAVYAHLPWCVRKCPYCDFNSHQAPERLPEADYVRALLADLDEDLARVAGREVTSVFIGGGTPSLFEPAAIADLLAGLAARLPLAAGCEITLEANPGAVDSARFEGFLAAGVNRLSVGVQSFDDELLARIGRIHDGRAAADALQAARDAGFARVNADLMFALPSQDEAQAVADVERALALGASHVSHYHLTLEPNTRFARFPPVLPDADTAAAMQDGCAAALESAGLRRYEVSAWSLPGEECRHNLNYWRFGDYLGLGAGAHGKLTDVAAGRVSRSARERHPRHYLARRPRVTWREVEGASLGFEFMLNALRLADGFETGLLAARTGLAPSALAPALEEARRLGLLEVSTAWMRPTVLGQRFLDDLVALFLPGGECARPWLYSGA